MQIIEPLFDLLTGNFQLVFFFQRITVRDKGIFQINLDAYQCVQEKRLKLIVTKTLMQPCERFSFQSLVFQFKHRFVRASVTELIMCIGAVLFSFFNFSER